MLFILNFLSSPIGKIVGYIGAGLILVLSIWIGIKIHDSNIRKNALIEYNRVQIEQTLKDKQKLIEENKKLNETQNLLIKDLNNKTQKLEETSSKLDSYLSDIDTIKQDKESSSILKRTIRELKDIK